MASDSSAEAAEVEKLYEFGERLNEAKDKSQVPLLLIFNPTPSIFVFFCFFVFCVLVILMGGFVEWRSM